MTKLNGAVLPWPYETVWLALIIPLSLLLLFIWYPLAATERSNTSKAPLAVFFGNSSKVLYRVPLQNPPSVVKLVAQAPNWLGAVAAGVGAGVVDWLAHPARTAITPARTTILLVFNLHLPEKHSDGAVVVLIDRKALPGSPWILHASRLLPTEITVTCLDAGSQTS